MNVIFSEKAEKELDELDSTLRKFFINHIEKLKQQPQQRHMKFGIPFNVEEVTKQARVIFEITEDCLHILHCFKNHKEYERWFKSFR